MILSLIVAMTRQHVIGVNNSLPWNLPGDLKRFKQITLGSPIIMGRKTYDSIGRPLPGRRNIVISRQADLKIAGVEVVSSLKAAIELVVDLPEVFVIGGGQIFAEALPLAQRLYITWIESDIAGDAYFPPIDFNRYKAVEDLGLIQEPIPHRYVNYSL